MPHSGFSSKFGAKWTGIPIARREKRLSKDRALFDWRDEKSAKNLPLSSFQRKDDAQGTA